MHSLRLLVSIYFILQDSDNHVKSPIESTVKPVSPVSLLNSGNDDSSDLNTDEECAALDVTKNFQRNKVYIVQLINSAAKSEADATDRLVVLHS